MGFLRGIIYLVMIGFKGLLVDMNGCESLLYFF